MLFRSDGLKTFGTYWCIYPDWQSEAGRWCTFQVNQQIQIPPGLDNQASMISVHCGKTTTRATLFVYDGTRPGTTKVGTVVCTKQGETKYSGVRYNDVASSGKVFAY